jgi:WD40 repeat protein
MHRAGRDSALRALLLDVEWLEAKLRATGVHSLIADFEHAGADRSLALLRDALQLSAPSLAADKEQLRSQLVGRLLMRDEPEIVALREAAALRAPQKGWLRLLHPTLDAPGGMLLMTLVGHGREVTSLAIDADFRRLVSGSNDGTVRVCDARDGQPSKVLYDEHNELGIRAVALSGDGQLALSGGANGRIYLWDMVHGELLHVSRDARRALSAVALSADGHIAVCASWELKLRVWDVRKRAVVHALVGHGEDVTAVAISSDGSRAVSGSDDHTLRVWNVGTGVLERTLEGHTGAVNAVALSADGRYALSGSADRTAKLWEVDTGTCLRTLTGHEASVVAVALAADAWRALSSCSDESVKLWDLANGKVLARLGGHSDVVKAIAIDPTGTRAATGSVDRTIKLWRLDDLRLPVQIDAHTGAVVSLVFSADGQLCASGGNDGRVKVRDVASGHVIRTFDAHPVPVRSLAFTQDGSCVLSGGLDAKYWLWTIESGESGWIPVRHGAPVDYSAFSPAARYMVTACADRFVYVWDVPSGVLIVRYGTRRLFDHLITAAPRRHELPQTEELLDTYLAGEAVYKVHIVRMSADGSHALLSATTGDSDSIRASPVLEGGGFGSPLRASACILALKIDTGEIDSISVPQTEPIIAFTVDASRTRLLWATQDHALELWDLQHEKKIASLRGHSERVMPWRSAATERAPFRADATALCGSGTLRAGQRLLLSLLTPHCAR